MIYERRRHGAAWTDDYIFNQLIPYIGNKRKLLDLIGSAIDLSGISASDTFLDLFAGSGVVSRLAKHRGLHVIANDWEPYAEAINRCYIVGQNPPRYGQRSYDEIIGDLNALQSNEGWITEHLCPSNDEIIDPDKDRLFFMRKNGMRLDTIRTWIQNEERAGNLTPLQRDCLIAPLLFAACYTSNTSGVFKGFHNGWGGQTGTALYRIQSDLTLRPARFHQGHAKCEVRREDAIKIAKDYQHQSIDFCYLDPPYNQHPYGSNYHVLNTIALWDAPTVPPKITGRGDKSAIRKDWRESRRSKFNYRNEATSEYGNLVNALNARFIATSYSTDGLIPLESLIQANLDRGFIHVLTKGYKRYRVSSQRFSHKPMNVEFILLTDTRRHDHRSVEEIRDLILNEESRVLREHARRTKTGVVSERCMQ